MPESDPMPGLEWPLSVPVLSDGTVTLRAHRPDDIDLMLDMANDPEMGRWTEVPQPHTREMSEDYAFSVIPRAWNEQTAAMWAIEAVTDTARSQYVGNIDIRGTGNPDIGYALHPRGRGRGLMTRAVRLAVEWTFANTAAEIIRWAAHVGNVDSLRVAHRTGFTLDGIAPGLLYQRGRAIDAWTGSIRPGDVMLPRTRWAEPVVIEGPTVRLRPYRDADVPRVVEACSDPVTRHWLGALPVPYTEAQARAYLDDCTWRAACGAKATWAVADSTTDELLANVAVMDMVGLNPTEGEIGYWTHPDARGRGVMTEALGLVLGHAFDPDGLDRRRLSLLAASGNVASNAIARHHGFRHVGTRREAEQLGDGGHDDLEEYELLRPT